MIAIVQRCTSASVKIDNKTIAEIDTGMVILLGVCIGDEKNDADYIAKKNRGA